MKVKVKGKVVANGNGTQLSLPKKVLESLGIKKGDVVEVELVIK